MPGSTLEEIKKTKDLPPLSTNSNSGKQTPQNSKSESAQMKGITHEIFSYNGDGKESEKRSDNN